MRLFIVALLAVVAMIASCANPKDLVYQDVKNFHVITLSLQPEVSMDIYINDKLIGKTNLQGSFAVPAADTFLLPVKLKADLRSLFANAYSLLANRTVTVKLHGSVKAGKGVFVNIPIHYEGKQKLHVLEKFN
jgi:LEA14-like dessication related protein